MTGECSTNQDEAYAVLTLYKFVGTHMTREQVVQEKDELEDFLRCYRARGALLVAPEGMNGTLCYRRQTDDPVYEFLSHRYPGLRTRLSYSSTVVFFRLRVRVKSEIVTLGVADGGVSPTQQVGEYVEPGPAWDQLVRDPDCWVIDARNDYEVRVGTFRNAVNPHTTSFTELPAWLKQQLEAKKPSKIAMFCTGGIRCEKATSYCLGLVRDQQIPVYHLKGGILGYLDQVDEKDSTFEGECYVFDQRIAVTHGLQPSRTYTACHACRRPLAPQDRQHPDFVHGVVCPYCKCDQDREMRRERYQARQKQLQAAAQKGILHIHDAKEAQAIISRKGIPQIPG